MSARDTGIDPYLPRVREQRRATSPSLVSFVGPFLPPLDLGLRVATRELAPLLGPSGVTTGSSSFDAELDVRADDDQRAQAFFVPELRAALLRLKVECLHMSVSDARVAFTADAADAARFRREAAQVCRLVDLARREVAPPERLAGHARALRDAAATHGLVYEPTPMRLTGQLRGVRVELSVRRKRRLRFVFELVARAPEGARAFGLRLRRETGVDRIGKWLGRQDIAVGDPRFDRAFLVQASEPAKALDALDAEARAALLDLADALDDVAVGDDALAGRVDPIRVDPSRVARLLEAAVTVMERVAHASGAVARGAYR